MSILSTLYGVCIYPIPQHIHDMTQSIFKLSKAGLYFLSETGHLIKAKEPVAGRTDGFMLFSRALAQSEMQTALSKIWTMKFRYTQCLNWGCTNLPSEKSLLTLTICIKKSNSLQNKCICLVLHKAWLVEYRWEINFTIAFLQVPYWYLLNSTSAEK